MVDAAGFGQALLGLLSFNPAPSDGPPFHVRVEEVQMDVEALEVIDVAIFRQEAGGLADEGGREDLPSLGWPLDRRGEATRLRQDFRADSLPTDIDVRPGTTYAVMATVSASDPQGVGPTLATSARLPSAIESTAIRVRSVRSTSDSRATPSSRAGTTSKRASIPNPDGPNHERHAAAGAS